MPNASHVTRGTRSLPTSSPKAIKSSPEIEPKVKHAWCMHVPVPASFYCFGQPQQLVASKDTGQSLAGTIPGEYGAKEVQRAKSLRQVKPEVKDFPPMLQKSSSRERPLWRLRILCAASQPSFPLNFEKLLILRCPASAFGLSVQERLQSPAQRA